MASTHSVLTYRPLQHSTPFVLQDGHELYPDARILLDLYRSTGFPETPEGRATMTVALRGSTAAFFEGDRLRFRHPKSDIDIVAVTGDAGRIGARYLFYTAGNLPDRPRNLDVLCFTPERLHAEERDPFRIFLMTKMIQPGVPIIAAETYHAYKVIAIATLMVQGAARQGYGRLTPSGGARLMLEEDLFAEPWRWESLRTYYVTGPSAERQRQTLTYLSQRALKRLENAGIATDVSNEYRAAQEPVYALDTSHLPYTAPVVDRLKTVFWFVYDQFRTLVHSNAKSINLDNGIRLLLKAASLWRNPTLRYDADLVFALK